MKNHEKITVTRTLAKQPQSRLKRPRHPMPKFARRALTERGLMTAYHNRPPYQQNEYIGWITRAKRKETQMRRLDQMLKELARGDRYMKMVYKPRRGMKRKARL